MHPPPFTTSHRLSDWTDCFLEIGCSRCEKRSFTMAVKGLQRWYGDLTFADLLSHLRCKFCRRVPQTVHLHAAYRSERGVKALPDWTLVIVPGLLSLKGEG